MRRTGRVTRTWNSIEKKFELLVVRFFGRIYYSYNHTKLADIQQNKHVHPLRYTGKKPEAVHLDLPINLAPAGPCQIWWNDRFHETLARRAY